MELTKEIFEKNHTPNESCIKFNHGMDNGFSLEFIDGTVWLYPSNEGAIQLPHIKLTWHLQMLVVMLSGQDWELKS